MIQSAFPSAEISLVRGGRGAFTVTVDGVEWWNKHERGEFPDAERLVDEMREALGG